MTRLRSGPLAAWASAWLRGAVASDEVLRAVTGTDAPHQVRQPDGGVAALSSALIDWRRLGAERIRCVLPVAGDVRGSPGPSNLRAVALEHGELAYGGSLALVPQVTKYAVSSRPTGVLWHAFTAEPVVPDEVSVREAQYELVEAMRACAGVLGAAELGGARGDIGEALADARRAGYRLNLPPGHPAPAVQLVAQAERLRAVLDLAEADAFGGAVDRVGAQLRMDALRPLAAAVRRARVAGYNA